MKETIRVTKHKGINIGYCNNCDYKEEIYQIRIGGMTYIEIRLCLDCLQKLYDEISRVTKRSKFYQPNILSTKHHSR